MHVGSRVTGALMTVHLHNGTRQVVPSVRGSNISSERRRRCAAGDVARRAAAQDAPAQHRPTGFADGADLLRRRTGGEWADMGTRRPAAGEAVGNPAGVADAGPPAPPDLARP